MKVKLRTLWAGPTAIYQPGEIVDVDKKTGEQLIQSHQATPVKFMQKETATA